MTRIRALRVLSERAEHAVAAEIRKAATQKIGSYLANDRSGRAPCCTRIGRHSLGTGTVKYAAGRELLVLVGEETIRYNNILGQSLEVPIVSRKRATDSKPSK
jgi:hypothetical protein